MKRMLVCLLAGAMVACFSTSAFAAAGDLIDTKIGLHAGGPSAAKNACTSGDAALLPGCDAPNATSALNTAAGAGQFYTYIFVMDIAPAAGLTAVEFALDFAAPGGVYIYGAGNTLCASAEFSAAGWPSTPNQGQTITWAACQNAVDANDPQGDAMVMAYILKCYGYANGGDLCVVPKPSTVYGAADCSASFTDLNPNYPVNAGCIGVGGGAGYQPCVGGVPVEETTWGAIKSQFEGE